MTVTAADIWPEQRLRESYVRHAARTQLYRLIAEGDDGASAAELLDVADPASRQVARSMPVPSLDGCRIDIRANGEIGFATVDGGLRGVLQRSEAFLPSIKRLENRVVANPTAPARSDARARATVHYFIALVENPARDPAPFHEILSDRFSLHYTSSPMTDLAGLDAWVRGALSSVVASEHDIHAIDVRELGDGRFGVDVRMTSQALFPDGSGAISRNTQNWTLVDTGERFALIEEILIDRDAVEFFGPAPDYAPRARPGAA